MENLTLPSFSRRFLGEYDPDLDCWWVERSFEYTTELLDRGLTKLYIPGGWHTDLASVPVWARWLIPRSGKYNQAAVLHDWIYRSGGIMRDENGDIICILSRKQADQLFYEAMKLLKVPKWKRKVMYRAVRMNVFNEKKFTKKS
jgi:hypothetical protein